MRRHEAFAKSIAHNVFQDFQNTDYQGPNFAWDKFPDLVGRMAETDLPLCYASQPANIEELKRETKTLATQHAQILVDEALERGALPVKLKSAS